MDELVSIIIPVYNVEEFLEECVDSALAQTYKNIEIFLVDDGSTDNSGNICDAYSKKDTRVRVIHKQNGGLSSARNAAMDIMKGKYVYFLDSDDYISDDMISRYVELMSQYDADIVMGTLYEFWGEVSNEIDHLKIELKPEIYNTEEALKNMLMDRKLYHAAAGPLYKSELFVDIRFPVGKLYEDFATSYYVVCKAKRVVYIDDKRYFYRMREGSIMNSKVTDKDMVMLDIADRIAWDMAGIYPSLEGAAIRKKIVTNIKLYSRILDTGFSSFPTEQKRIRENVKNNCKEFFYNKEIRKIDKIKVLFFYFGKIPFYIIYKANDVFQRYRKKAA